MVKKGFEKRFDAWLDTLSKKQYFEFMAIDKLRSNMWKEAIKEETIKKTYKYLIELEKLSKGRHDTFSKNCVTCKMIAFIDSELKKLGSTEV